MSKIIRKCIVCQKEFVPKKETQKYCSKPCQHIGSKKEIEKVCYNCGKIFKIKPCHDYRKYCSQECSKEALMVWKTCPQCGKQFRRSRRTYCSKKCDNESRLGQIPWNKNPYKVNCIICGKEFNVPMGRKDSTKYCSYACQHEAKRRITGKEHPLFLEKKVVKCQWCGKEFKVKPCKEHEAKYCSRFCVGSAITASQGGRKSSLELIVKNELDMLNIDYIEQKRLGKYLVDFYLPSANVVIEADGDYWHNRPERKQKDIKKDQYLISRGYKVLRFKEQDIKNNIQKCMNLLKQAM